MNTVTNKQPIKVAIYARVSTEMQSKDGFSIDAQVETLTQHCKKLGYEIYNVYIDKGLSGSDMTKRPSLQAMLEDSRLQRFDKLYVWKLSRLARNLRDLISMVETLQEHSVDFHSFSEQFEVTTSTGMFMMQLLAAVGEYERNIIIDNVKLGQEQRAYDGYTNGARVLGYDKPESPREPVQINIYEAEIIRQIFDLYQSGKGFRAIANHLNKQGFKTKKEKPFSISAVKYILNNPIYAGKVRFNLYLDYEKRGRKNKNEDYILVEGKHKPIITKEQWTLVQKQLKERSYLPRVLGSGSNVVTGLLKCPKCGSAMIAANTTNTLKDGTKKRIRYYSCQRFRAQGASVCSANSIRADDIEAAVQKQILLLLNQPLVLKQVIREANERAHQRQVSINNQSPQLESDIVELGAQITRLQEASKADNELKLILSERVEQLTDELNLKKEQLKKVTNQKVDSIVPDIYTENDMEKVLKRLADSFKQENKMQIKQMYLAIIDKITFKKEKGKRKIDDFTIYLKKDIGTTLLENTMEGEAHQNGASPLLYSKGIIINNKNSNS